MTPSRHTLQYYSIMCESFLLGVYAVLVLFICWILKARRRHMPKTHKVLFGASILMWFLAAAHFALLMQEATTGVIRPIRPVGQTLIVLATTQIAIGDLILIWRVWVVWNRRYLVVIAPLGLMIASAGLTIELAVSPDDHAFFYSTVPVVLIVANTSICTFLIVGRIWYLRYGLRKVVSGINGAPSQTSTSAMALLIESGTLYAISQLINLILYYVKSNGLSVMLNLEMPLIGILPTLIIVLVHFRMVYETEAPHTAGSGIKFHTPTTKVILDTALSEDTTLAPTIVSSKGTQVDASELKFDQRYGGPDSV